MEAVHEFIEVARALVPFTSATWFVIFIMVFMFIIFSNSNKKCGHEARIKWEDLIIDPEIDKVSPYKVGYLIGVVVSTWIVISLSDGTRLTFDIMGLYLSYLLGGAGWSEFVNRKRNDERDDGHSSSRNRYNEGSNGRRPLPPLTSPPPTQSPPEWNNRNSDNF